MRVVADVHVAKLGIRSSEICIVYMFENDSNVGSLSPHAVGPGSYEENGVFTNLVALNSVDQLDDIRT
jgi:hypothetical protein